MELRTILTPREAAALGLRPGLQKNGELQLELFELSRNEREALESWSAPTGTLCSTSEVVARALRAAFPDQAETLAGKSHVQWVTSRLPLTLLNPDDPAASLVRHRCAVDRYVVELTEQRIQIERARLADFEEMRDYHLGSSDFGASVAIRCHQLGRPITADWPLEQTGLILFFSDDRFPDLPPDQSWEDQVAFAAKNGSLVAVRKVVALVLSQRIHLLEILRGRYPEEVRLAEAGAVRNRQEYLAKVVDWACTSRAPFCNDSGFPFHFDRRDGDRIIALVTARRDELFRTAEFAELRRRLRAKERARRSPSPLSSS